MERGFESNGSHRQGSLPERTHEMSMHPIAHFLAFMRNDSASHPEPTEAAAPANRAVPSDDSEATLTPTAVGFQDHNLIMCIQETFHSAVD